MIGVPAFAFGVLFGSLAMRLLRLQGRRAATWVRLDEMGGYWGLKNSLPTISKGNMAFHF
jgi:hypothetical protein